MAKRRHFFWKAILIVLVVGLLALGMLIGSSVVRMKGQVEEALRAYDGYEAFVEEGQTREAVESLKSLAANVAEIEREADSFVWHIARNLPVIGEDVACLQQVADISDRLANRALLPVLQQIEGVADLLDADGMTDERLSELISTAPDQIRAIVDSLLDARVVVSQCNEDAAAVPPSHFAEVNELVQKMRSTISQSDEVLDKIEPWLDGAGLLSSLFA